MHSVILIDDEPMALEGLALLVDWEGEGFAIAAQFSAAQAALDHLAAHAPALVVTDLYMPGMDGVTLMQRAREGGYAGHFVIASGHQDFEMAQQALRYGAVGYLLKPIDPDEARQTLREVATLLRDQPDGGRHWQRRGHALAQLQALLTRADAPTDSLPQGGFWQLITIGQPLTPDTLRPLEDTLARGGVDMLDAVVEGTQYIALHAADKDAIARGQAVITATGSLSGRTLLAGETPTGLGGVHAQCAALQARLDALRARVKALITRMQEDLTLLEQDSLRVGMRELIALARSHSVALERTLLARWWTECYGLFARVPEEAQAYLRLVGTEAEARELPLETGLTRLGSAALDLLRRRDDSLEERMLRYAKAHHCESISLATMAQALGHSSAYLGRVFARRVGMSFRPWLNQYRLELAARQIAADDRPIYQIAEAVGYTKYSYFLEKFKAAYGMMPEAYRKAHGGK